LIDSNVKAQKCFSNPHMLEKLRGFVQEPYRNLNLNWPKMDYFLIRCKN